nr:unnamed protein product [Spirometra erinaceieuropaei]
MLLSSLFFTNETRSTADIETPEYDDDRDDYLKEEDMWRFKIPPSEIESRDCPLTTASTEEGSTDDDRDDYLKEEDMWRFKIPPSEIGSRNCPLTTASTEEDSSGKPLFLLYSQL